MVSSLVATPLHGNPIEKSGGNADFKQIENPIKSIYDSKLEGSNLAPSRDRTATQVDAPAAKSGERPTVKRVDDVPPSFFYSYKGTKVKCNSAAYVYDNNLMADTPADLPDSSLPMRERVGRHLSKADFVSRDAALWYITTVQRQCSSCICDETGRLRFSGYGKPPGTKRLKHCTSDAGADACAQFFACFCFAELAQPTATTVGLTVVHYQNALNAIPLTIKLKNPGYSWKWGGQELRWSEETMKLRSNNRRLVPGTKEPYYVEGPGNGDRWSWLENLNLGSSSLGGLAGPKKRGLEPDRQTGARSMKEDYQQKSEIYSYFLLFEEQRRPSNTAYFMASNREYIKSTQQNANIIKFGRPNINLSIFRANKELHKEASAFFYYSNKFPIRIIVASYSHSAGRGSGQYQQYHERSMLEVRYQSYWEKFDYFGSINNLNDRVIYPTHKLCAQETPEPANVDALPAARYHRYLRNIKVEMIDTRTWWQSVNTDQKCLITLVNRIYRMLAAAGDRLNLEIRLLLLNGDLNTDESYERTAEWQKFWTQLSHHTTKNLKRRYEELIAILRPFTQGPWKYHIKTSFDNHKAYELKEREAALNNFKSQSSRLSPTTKDFDDRMGIELSEDSMWGWGKGRMVPKWETRFSKYPLRDSKRTILPYQ
ncbi:hypothetical protein H072_10540 [Dactylellina haptotyla CBS 200.50]|uniref:Uncharacterized protein n=1 Tax=Dactylellina haptotyla (strain CBS 200.50) TaxID=1284197 RepID=S7ZZ12_DACHA|nr:hypothetical protein H072_10540 [Dactylellina haptotyla CBS 200.50]